MTTVYECLFDYRLYSPLPHYEAISSIYQDDGFGNCIKTGLYIGYFLEEYYDYI